MSAGQELLLRRHLTERLVPLVSAGVPLFAPMTGCLRGRDRRSANVAANLPNDAFIITSNCGRNRRQNRLANTRFWVDLTIFRMNTCAKRIGGGGPACVAPFSTEILSRPKLSSRGPASGQSVLGAKRCPARGIWSWRFLVPLSLEGLGLRIKGSWRKGAFKGAGVSTAQPRVGVQLHPRSDCATVRLKVPVTTSREAAVPCAHL
jgi:hypothetical protein